MSDKAQGSTATGRLRADVDSGRTADKIPFPDPAAAPLGTDDEAGGSPPPCAAVAASAATAREAARGLPVKSPDQTGPWVWAVIGTIVLVVAAAAAVLYWPAG